MNNSHLFRQLPTFLTGLLAAGLQTGCATHVATPVSTPSAEFDRPVAADVPRGSDGFTVSLEPAADCEETFDLKLYQDRRVDLIKWDVLQRRSRCANRNIFVRYLSKSLSPDELFELVQKHSLEAKRRNQPNPAPATKAAAAPTESK